MAYRLAVIEQFAGLTVAEGPFWKQKSPTDLDRAGFWKVWLWAQGVTGGSRLKEPKRKHSPRAAESRHQPYR
ncbi:hypothetical protein MesoLj131a_52940 [Mesorhizobium sp. 131-2-1]|nr:hypothetical protein MesoLj131a_52940 [Mesorhizobium sp. 131-2-1]